jgi:Trp operon repressor
MSREISRKEILKNEVLYFFYSHLFYRQMVREKKKLKSLIQLFLALRNESETSNLFEDMFTPQEIEAFVERWEVVRMLLETNISQREIAKKLGCSVALVSRASRQIKYGTKSFSLLHKRMQKKSF